MKSSEQFRILPADTARCKGAGYEEPLGNGLAAWEWREGCEDCLRRTSPGASERQPWIEAPAIIVIACEWRIEP